MKRLLFSLAIATTLAIAIGLVAYYFGPGYVVFSFAEVSVETSFIFTLGFLAFAFFIFHYLIRVLSIFLRIPDYLGLRYSSRQAEKARNALVKGLIEMSEGRFSQAEKILLKQVIHSDTGLLNYLMAARSAQQLGAYDRRDEYLRLAHETTPSADIAIGITQAELQLAHNQYEQALATLNHLQSITPKHAYVKKLQARVYQQLGDWDSLSKLLSDVRKHKYISDEKLKAIEIETYTGLLNKKIKTNNLEKTRETWQNIPRPHKESVGLLKLYVEHLISHKQGDDAEILLRTYLANYWQESLIGLYAKLDTSNPQKQLETAETWLHSHARSAALLLVLGKLAMKCQLWGKARSYLESSLGIKPLSEAYLELAVLLEEKMDEVDLAQTFYKKGLKLAVDESSRTIRHDQANLSKFTFSKDAVPKLKIIQ